ncbi:MAG: hypothetical protein EBY18_16515 [Alphaproteobacteria bacterium]|nr:hypothetical protein [Alphaproteobacteria bacterium]
MGAAVSNNLALRMLMHASAAAAAFFMFQHYGLGATLETGLLWALAGAVGAAALAWSQRSRGG